MLVHDDNRHPLMKSVSDDRSFLLIPDIVIEIAI